jgi:large subunit ribosomal protein L6
MKYKIKSLLIPSGIEMFFFIGNENKKSIITLKKESSKENLNYYTVPNFIIFEKLNNLITFKIDKNVPDSSIVLNSFFSLLSKGLKLLDKPYKKKLILKGLGFKASLSTDLSFLELKLGYSHTIKIKVPLESLTVKVDKSTLIVEGSDPVKVGNFATQIRNLKYPDSYKGKGFWYKNEIIALKEVKKT